MTKDYHIHLFLPIVNQTNLTLVENMLHFKPQEEMMSIEIKKITIFDVARLAGVSITTVSRVINDKKKGVATETKRKVLRIIQKYDYYPDTYAQYLGQRNHVKSSKITQALSQKYGK